MAKKNGKMLWLTIGCVAALVLSGGSLIRQISKETTKEVSSYSYTIAGLDEDGKLDKENKGYIVSDKFNVDKLESIEVDEDADVTVFVVWYMEDGACETVKVTDGTPVPIEGAKSFRILIEATGDEDGEVSAFEKGGYVNQVKVTLKK